MTKQLSPAAQAVLDAAFRIYDEEEHLYVVPAEKHAGMVAAAALRAATQQTGKRKTLKTLGVTMAQGPAYCFVADLLAIADELEAQ